MKFKYYIIIILKNMSEPKNAPLSEFDINNLNSKF